MQYCRVEPSEKVVVFTDTAKSPATIDAFFTAALATGAEVVLITVEANSQPLIDPPSPAVRAMVEADVVFDLASQPWLYTQATNTIINSGTRMLQVLVSDEAVVARPPEELIARREDAARAVLRECRTFRITSPYGTDIVIEHGDRPIHTQGGFVDHPGDWDSYGVCLGAFAPPEDKANGRLALHGTVYLPPQHVFMTDRPIVTEVRDGRLVAIETDHPQAQLLDEWLKSWNDPNSNIIAHTGFGIDHRARLQPPDPGAWESYLAGVNIAFGGNNIPQLQGKTECKSHFDVVLLNTNVDINDKRVIDSGRFVRGLGFD